MTSCFDIIEHQCVSKTGREEDREDLLLVTNDYIAVVDGATSKSSARFQGKTGGRIAAELVAHSLTTMGKDIEAPSAVDQIQQALQDYDRCHQLEQQGIHLCAAAVIYSVAHRQLWSVGDCQFMVNGILHTFPKAIDSLLAETRSAIIHMLLQEGYTEHDLMQHDLARDIITPALQHQLSLENASGEYGYPIFSTRGSVSHIEIFDIPEQAEVVLASDGYPRLCATLLESEQQLSDLLRMDPLCYQLNKATKGLTAGRTSTDDRTYIRFRI